MSEKPSKMNGAGEQILGSAKSVVGSVTGNETIKQSGDEQKFKGDAEYRAKQSEEKMKSVGNEASGQIKEKVGGLFSDDQKAKGQSEQIKSDAQNEASKH